MHSNRSISDNSLVSADIGGLSVLLVDDNKVNQFLGKRILNNLGIRNVSLASSGRDALELIQSQSFDILLTDVEMPGMNGYELCRTIRNSADGQKRLRIIALTANDTDDDRKMAAEAGIDDYIIKPYTPQDLLTTILRNAGNGKEIVLEEMAPAVHVKSAGFEKAYLLFHHNTADVKQFLKMVSQQLPQLLDSIRTAQQTDDAQMAFQAIHKLKSPVSLLVDDTLLAKITHLTEVLRDQTSLSSFTGEILHLSGELEALMVRVNSELESIDSQ